MGFSPRVLSGLILSLGWVLSGCGSATSSSANGAGSGARTVRTVPTASCAVRSAAAQRAADPTVFLALALAGLTARVGNQSALTSPARMRVLRYVKGSGPTVVSVVTAVTRGGRITEDRIVPHRGERWEIFSDSQRSPYATSICDGSRRLPALVMGVPGGGSAP